MKQHVALDADDFAKLVNGEVVEKEECRIILSDIGFSLMTKIVADATIKQVVNQAAAEAEMLCKRGVPK
jgi:hypothetical protein